MNSPNLIAKLNLAWNLVLHLCKRPFQSRGEGYRLFLENYAEEGLLPLSREDKDRLASYSRCVNCGLCDAVCPALIELPREKFPGPSYLVTTLTRSLPEMRVADLDFSRCESCRECERACPTRVPLQDAFQFIKFQAQRLRSLPAPSPLSG